MERLFGFENFSIYKFDKDFNSFCSKSIFLNYEFCKVMIKREQENNEKLQKVIKSKNDELKKMKEQVVNLEKVKICLQIFNFYVFFPNNRPFLKSRKHSKETY